LSASIVAPSSELLAPSSSPTLLISVVRERRIESTIRLGVLVTLKAGLPAASEAGVGPVTSPSAEAVAGRQRQRAASPAIALGRTQARRGVPSRIGASLSPACAVVPPDRSVSRRRVV